MRSNLLFTSRVLHARALIFHPLRHHIQRSHWSVSVRPVRQGRGHEGQAFSARAKRFLKPDRVKDEHYDHTARISLLGKAKTYFVE